MIDCFVKRMTVLGRGLVFQPVLVTQACTYNSNNIALQNIGITERQTDRQTDRQRKRERERERERPSEFHKDAPSTKPQEKTCSLSAFQNNRTVWLQAGADEDGYIIYHHSGLQRPGQAIFVVPCIRWSLLFIGYGQFSRCFSSCAKHTFGSQKPEPKRLLFCFASFRFVLR